MNRHLKYTIVFAGVAVLLIVWCGRAGAGPENKSELPASARQAEQLFEKQLKGLRTEFEARQRRALVAHLGRLTALQSERTSARDLDGALAIRTRIEELESESERQVSMERQEYSLTVARAMKDLRGTWTIDWSSGVGGTRTFQGRNQVKTGEDARGNLYRKHGDLIIEFQPRKNRVIERLTIVNGRLVIEHFNPKVRRNTYPNGPPVMVGVGQKR